MKKFLLLTTACTLAACAPHAPTDSELATLLRRENAPAGDPKAPLDTAAVQCLRAWSGDAALTKGLSAAATADITKGRCRSTIDGWLADGKRNPAKLVFDQVSTPASVRRAMALLAERGPAEPAVAAAPPVAAPPMAAPMPPVAAKPRIQRDVAASPEPEAPAPEIESTLAQAGDLCTQVKAFVATNQSDVRLNRYAEYCTTQQPSITRSNVDRMKASGDQAGVDRVARSTANSNATVEAMLHGHQK